MLIILDLFTELNARAVQVTELFVSVNYTDVVTVTASFAKAHKALDHTTYKAPSGSPSPLVLCNVFSSFHKELRTCQRKKCDPVNFIRTGCPSKLSGMGHELSSYIFRMIYHYYITAVLWHNIHHPPYNTWMFFPKQRSRHLIIIILSSPVISFWYALCILSGPRT